MAANMTHLGGGQLGRRPQSNQQLPQLLYSQIIQHPVPTGGWRTAVSPNMRVGHVMNIITNTLLAMPQADSNQVIHVALNFERDAYTGAQDKATYEGRILGRVNDLYKKRQANEQNIQNSLSQAAQQNQAQMMMNPNMQMRSLGQPLQQGFQALHQQMQPPPMNQPGQPNINLNHPTGLPMNPNQQAMQMGAQMRPQPTQGARLAGLSPQDQLKAQQLAVRKIQEMGDPLRNQLRGQLSQKYGPQIMGHLQHEGVDPLLWYFQSQFGLQILQSMKGQAGANQSGMPVQAHQQRAMNQPGQQLPTGPNGEYGPFANVESIMNQQKAGLIAQEAGQMVVPASIGAGRNATPQPMGSVPGPNQGAGQPTLPHQPQQQQFNHQPAQQLKMDQLAAQSQAQIRAQAQAKQIHGQPGGLNGPGGTSQSPAMNTLNTPVRRSPMGVGQTEGYAQLGQGNMPFAQQIMDPRFNQAGQRTPVGPNGNIHKQQVLHNLLQQLPPETQQHIMHLPPDKMQESIMKWHNSRGAGPVAGRPQNGPNPIHQPVNQPQAMNQFQAANSHFGQHPNNNVQVNQHSQAMMQQMNKIRGSNMAPGSLDRQAFMDNMAIPPKILDQLRMSSPQANAFPELKKWAQLKQWIAQKTLPQQTIQSLLAIQNAQFQTILKAAQQGSAAAGVQPSQPNSIQQGIHNNGQANPQMAQPATNMAPSNPEFQITAVEIQNVRNNNREKFKDVSDDQIKQLLIQMKMRIFQNKANKTAGAPAQTPQITQTGHSATAPTPSQPVTGTVASQAQQNVAPETSTSSPAIQGRNMKQTQNRPAPTASAAPTTKTGTKRPMPDDAGDVVNAVNTPVQRPHGQPAQPTASLAPPRIPQLTPEQVASMQSEQQQKYGAMVNRQSGQAPVVSEEVTRLKAIGQEQHLVAMKELYPDIHMSPEQYRDAAQRIQSMCIEMTSMGKVLVKWYSATRNDGFAKSFFHSRLRLVKQYVDGEKMTALKPKLSITPAELDNIRNLLETMNKEVAIHYPNGINGMRRNPSQQQSAEPTPAQSMSARPGAPTTNPAQLNAANLDKQTQAFNRMHQRNNSRAGTTPAAPTTSQPPFSFGAQSPDGQPTYATKPAITQENLQLPARKKVKTEARAGMGPNQTGPSINASPQVQKLSSPEMGRRQAPPDAKQTAAAPKILCSDQYCEFRSIGFPTEEALHKHIEEDHTKPTGDPIKFAADGLAEAMGLDSNGKVKKIASTGGNVRSPADTSKHAQTPTGRAEPTISREAPMRRQGSAAGSKPNELIRTIAGKIGTPKADLPSKTTDGTTAMMTHATRDEVMGNTIDPQELLSGVTGLETGGGGAILDMNVYRAITPNDTPESSKDSASSEPNSDVSEGVTLNVNIDMGFDTWDPFGFGYTTANMELGNMDSLGGLPYPGFSWDEINPDFDKPFTLNTDLFSLDSS
ncbi:hypothetical protein F5Y14DRAFT_17262 [Nemania sp. NC0429]|nr:hypothetical protein F5Y14DRAFT_17262 [Nemania sp. NC0429]